MSTLGVLARGMLVATSLTSSPPVARADDEQTIDRARTLLKLLIDGEYDQFVAAGDETMQARFTAQQARVIWESLEARLGDYVAEESATLTPVGQYNSVRFVLCFQRARQQLRLVLDQQGRLSGLWRDHTESLVAYEPPEYVDTNSFREEELTVSAGAFPLPATLTIPTVTGPFPGVVLVHGSGPHDRDETVGGHKPFRDLAWGLASRGVAVLRYEKRTKAHPTARRPNEWRLADVTIEDALAGAKLLRRRPEIDPQRVYVLGHSLGGVAAPYIAQRDDKLAGIIVLAGNARSILDLIEEQTEYLARLDGSLSPAEQEQIDKLRKTTAAIRAGRLAEATALSGLPAGFLLELHQLNPPEAAARLDLPILVLQGGRDYQVTRADYALWKKHLAARENATLKLFEPLNHLFSAGTGPSTPAEYQQPGHVHADVIEAIVGWISGQTYRPH